MSTTIGKDGLTDEERRMRASWVSESDAGLSEALLILNDLAAERLAHAETRARAEKAEAERDRLRAALLVMVTRCCLCLGTGKVNGFYFGPLSCDACIEARALLGEVKP
jgi:hypothetical protein